MLSVLYHLSCEIVVFLGWALDAKYPREAMSGYILMNLVQTQMDELGRVGRGSVVISILARLSPHVWST